MTENKLVHYVTKNGTLSVLIITLILGLMVIWFGFNISKKIFQSCVLVIICGLVYNALKCPRYDV